MTNVHVSADAGLLTIRVDLPAVAEALSRQAEEWRQTAERTRSQWEQSEWYLGEAKASIERLEAELQALREAHGQLEAGHREATARVQEVELERDATRETTLRRTEHLEAQLAQAQEQAEETRREAENWQLQFAVERDQRTALEAELGALRTHGERRRVLRTFRPDVTAQIQSPTGEILFEGLPRNISSRGFRFASDHTCAPGFDALWVTFHQPGMARPIEALGRVVWHGPETEGNMWGCELVDMSPGCRKIFDQILATPA
jgi:PilZ domain-containing protein